MQTKLYQFRSRATSPKTQRFSINQLSQSTDSSCKSIEAGDDQYTKCAIRWILAYNKKITKDTNYLALSYLCRLADKSILVHQTNWEQIAVTLLLLASKTNEIYPPKISSLIAKCKGSITKEEIIDMEAYILNAFDFDIALSNTPYSHLIRILGQTHKNKLEECEKLFRMVAGYPQIYRWGDEVLAYALSYLMVPQYVRAMKLKEHTRIKAMATKIYQTYNEVKQLHDSKENKCF